jgi:peptide/nickel transport system substrate-binding protein
MALGRRPYGNVLKLRLPWPMDSLDPHAIDDVTAALFGTAIADSLYALDAKGRPYSALASALPELDKDRLRVSLRPNLLSALGRPMDARDVLWSLARSEQSGGAGLLAPLGKPAADPKDPLTISFPTRDAVLTATALASPLTAILPRAFSNAKPDGTGAFKATLARDRLVLVRNPNAARGAPYLDRIEVGVAPDLKDSLRAFEAGETDVSWLGEFLHKARAGAVKYDAGVLGWVVLRTGKDAGTWGAPGVAQKLLDAIPSGRLSYLGLTAASGGRGGSSTWGGEPAEILVPDNAPHLAQIGKELVALMSAPAHELRVAVRPRTELQYRRSAGRFSLLLEVVRPVGNGKKRAELALYTAVNPTMAKKPPNTAPSSPSEVARTLPLGVVGQLGMTGAHASTVHEFASWELGGVWKK